MTQKEIARELGVSVATVSMALSGNPRIKEETVRKVRTFADKYNYIANESARNLVSGRTNTIGILFPGLSDNFYSQLAVELQNILLEHGYTPLITCVRNQDDERKLADLLLSKQVDGIISKHLETGTMMYLQKGRTPAVFYSLAVDGIDSVVIDRAAGVCQGMRHLWKLGRKKTGYIGNCQILESRYSGYRQFLMSHDIELNESWTIDSGGYYRDGYDSMLKLLRAAKLPDSIVCHNDMVAIGAMCAAFEKGVRIPDDIAIIGFDNIAEGEFAAVPLTTLNVDKFRLAKNLVEILMKNIKDTDTNKVEQRILIPELVVRKSCGA